MLRSDWKKKVLVVLVSSVIAFMGGEAGLRGYLAFKIGPSALLYGTPLYRDFVEQGAATEFRPDGDRYFQQQSTSYNLEGYTKYFPHQSLRGVYCTKDGSFDIRINNRGFRGKDIVEDKTPGVIRIVTLGASSTFGYCDQDTETYPYQLETLLNNEGQKSYEVINLGVPHLRSSQIVSLFVLEALVLEPDIVTFYEGHNDVHDLKREPLERTLRIPALDNFIDAMGKHLVFFARLRSGLRMSNKGFTAQYLYEPAKVASQRFLENVSVINEENKKRGILFIVATQQKRSLMIESEDLVGITYKQEVALVEEKLASEVYLSQREFGFLAHDIFMDDLVLWASENNVPLIDVIGALDQRRDTILTPVHISALGNGIIARAFAHKILSEVEPGFPN